MPKSLKVRWISENAHDDGQDFGSFKWDFRCFDI